MLASSRSKIDKTYIVHLTTDVASLLMSSHLEEEEQRLLIKLIQRVIKVYFVLIFIGL